MAAAKLWMVPISLRSICLGVDARRPKLPSQAIPSIKPDFFHEVLFSAALQFTPYTATLPPAHFHPGAALLVKVSATSASWFRVAHQ